VRAAGIFAWNALVFRWYFLSRSMKNSEMLIKHFSRKRDVFTVDLVASELAVVVNSDHVIDKTTRRQFRSKFAISAISSACNEFCFFDFPVEAFSMFIEKIQMSLRQTEMLCYFLKFIRDLLLCFFIVYFFLFSFFLFNDFWK